MPHYIIYIACVAFFLGMNTLGVMVNVSDFNGIGIVLILFLGIPHGALDNEISKRANGYSSFRFYLSYLSFMAFYLCLWLIWPVASLALFLLSSAYHFGQSQFSDLKSSSSTIKCMLYMSWGVLLLTCLVLLRWAELEPLLQANADTMVLGSIISPAILSPLAVSAAIVLLTLIVFLVVRSEMSLSRACSEILLLGVLAYSFSVFPLVLAFALYFCILHSLRVLEEEYHELSAKNIFASLKGFIALLAPLSIVSYLGAAGLFWAYHADLLPMSDLKMVFVMTSLITLPHCFVMEFFYRLRASKRVKSRQLRFPSQVRHSKNIMERSPD